MARVVSSSAPVAVTRGMIRVVATGKNPTMRYLARTHRVSVAWLHEVCQMKEIRMVYEATSRMCADIFTKASSNAVAWRHDCDLVQIVDLSALPTFVRSLDLSHDVLGRSSLARGGYPTATLTTLRQHHRR